MAFWRRRFPLTALLVGASCATPPPETPTSSRWWKGNLHTHSFWSDGDDYPEPILDWYKSAGYDFVALSDHNILAEGEKWIRVSENGGEELLSAYRDRFGEDWVDEKNENGEPWVRLKTFEEYRGLFEQQGEFLLLQGEEITSSFAAKPIHVNATNVNTLIEPRGGDSVRDVIQNNVDAVFEQRLSTGQLMFPHVNHPNFGWAVTVEDLIALRGEKFFEVYNGHPAVHNEGDELRPSTERMWDILLAERLTNGEEVMYGLAVDDAHNYHGFDSEHSNPGRGWVMVRAASLDAESLVLAMESGNFYGSSGVQLERVDVTENALSLTIRPEEGVSYRTSFIGTRRGYDRKAIEVRVEEEGAEDGVSVLHRYSDTIGEVLAVVEGTSPSYRFDGTEMYVRAKTVSSRLMENPYRDGEHEASWVQPVVLVPAHAR